MSDQLPPQILRHIIENLPVGLVVIDGDRFVVNRAVEIMSGYDRGELISIERWFELLYRHEALWMRAKYEARKSSGQTAKRVLSIYHKSGEIRQVEISAFFDQSTEFWLLNDITEQMALNRRFELVFTRAHDGICILEYGADGLVFKNVNPAALHIIDEPDEFTVVGKTIASYLPDPIDGRSRAVILGEMRLALGDADGSFNVEYEKQGSDHAGRWLRLSLHKLQGQGRDMVLAVWHDLTEERRLQAQASYASKMVSLGEMSSGLAHELNTPLAVIKGKAQYLLRMAERADWDPELWTTHLSKIDATVNRMATIVTGLRAFARDSNQDAPVAVPLRKIVSDTLSFCTSRFALREVVLKDNVSSDLIVLCRPSQIAQVLLNLLNNAFDAVVDAAPDRRWVEINASPDVNDVIVRVRDGGPGVPAGLRDRVMQPFFTTKPVGKGTGLGLSISSGILASHGGELAINVDDPHTCFEFRLTRAVE